jgi:gliding motility-associated-like protein
VIQLGPDVKTCEGTPVLFEPDVPDGTFFLWNNADVSSSYTARESQQLTVSASYEGCVRRDTVAIEVLPAPDVSLGNDTTICEGQALLLQVPIVPGEQYKWSDGSSTPAYQPITTDSYAVTVKGVNQCSTSDTIAVTFSQKPVLSLPGSLLLCRGAALNFEPRVDWATQFVWNDGVSTGQRNFAQPGKYSLQVMNSCGSASGDLIVKDAGVCTLIFPNVFSPNHDGKNDVFISSITSGLDAYSLTIYNRWGQIVFRSSDPSQGWDGRVAGKPAEAGSYVWMLSYRSAETELTKNQKGSVLLIR